MYQFESNSRHAAIFIAQEEDLVKAIRVELIIDERTSTWHTIIKDTTWRPDSTEGQQANVCAQGELSINLLYLVSAICNYEKEFEDYYVLCQNCQEWSRKFMQFLISNTKYNDYECITDLNEFLDYAKKYLCYKVSIDN